MFQEDSSEMLEDWKLKINEVICAKVSKLPKISICLFSPQSTSFQPWFFFAFMFFVFRNISGTGCHIHKKLRKFNQQFSYNFLYQLTRFLGLANCNSRHIIKNSLDHIYSNTHGYVIDFEIEELFRNKKPQISQRQDYFLVKRRKYFIK